MVSAAGGGGGGGGGTPKPKPYTPPAPTPYDPMKELAAIMAALGGGGGSVDYQAEARNIYAPQFGYLDKLSGDAVGRAAEGKKDVGALYNALAASIQGQEKGIKNNYSQGLAGVKGAYGAAQNNIDTQFDETRNNSAEILERLGIQQAGGNVIGKSNQMEQLLQGIMGANNLAAQNVLNQGQQSSLAFNQAQVGASKLAGADAQKGIDRQLNDFLNQIMGKKADLNSQVAQSAFSMEQDAQKSAIEQARDQYKMMMDERDFNYRMAKDKADYDLRASQLLNGDKSKMDPMGQAQQLALSLYGNEQSAGNAMKAISDAMMEAGNNNMGEKPTLAGLLSVLQNRLKGANGGINDWSSLQRLAALMYDM